MKISVTAKPKKKVNKVEQINPTHYVVSVKEPPVDGRANQAIIKLLSEYFGITASQIKLLSGNTGKIKILEIPDSLADFHPLPHQEKLL